MGIKATSKLTIHAPSPGCFLAVCRAFQVLGALMLFGAVLGFRTPVGYVTDAFGMRNWEPTPAVILKAELKATPEDENRYVHARYRYRYGGVERIGERVDAAGHIMGALPEQERMAAELQELQRSGIPTTCYVNPADPSEAVLFRQLDYLVLVWALLAPSLFAVFGLGLFVIGTLALGRERRQAAIRAAHPEEPWMWRADWAAGRIPANNYKHLWILVAAALVYLLVALPLGLLILNQRGWAFWSWPTAVLLLIAWGFFNGTWMALKAGRKWKRAVFRMNGPHGLIGGPLAGVVEVPRSASADATFRIRLECFRIVRLQESGTRLDVLWHDQTTVHPTRSSERSGDTVIPVYFAIPFSCDPTDPSDNQDFRWRLRVDEGDNNSPQAIFEVPVFKTAASSRGYQEDPSVLEPYLPPDQLQQTVAEHCRIELLPGGGEQLRFSMFRTWALIAALVLIGLCTAGITALQYFDFHFVWTIMPAVFMAMVVAGTLAMLLWEGRVTIRPEAITITAGLLGFRKVRTVPRDTFIEHSFIESLKEWSGQETTDWHAVRLVLILPNPKFDETKVDPEDPDFDLNGEPRLLPPDRLVVAKRIDSRRTAEQLADWLGEKLGLAKTACDAE